MVIELLLFVVGLVLLSISAERFVFGAAALARNLGIAPMTIGLTIVAMGSSAPEIVISAIASYNGNVNAAVGNALGSNITNIALVLGITVLVKPLLVSSRTLKREYPLLIATNLLACYIMYDGGLTRGEGILLISLFFATLAAMTWLSIHAPRNDPLITENQDEIPKDVANTKAIFWLVVGIITLPLSAGIMVDSAVSIARILGVSDLVIGLTIIAFGTSLPELAASIAGVKKGEDDIALGNVIGSNIFNLLAVLGMPALIAPGDIAQGAFQRDMYVMLGLTIMLLLFSLSFRAKSQINRLEGSLFVICFAMYQVWLFNS